MKYKEWEADGEITESDREEWQRQKAQKATPVQDLSREQTMVFLQLVAELRTPVLFERKLGLSRREIEHHKARLGVENQESARRLLSVMQRESQEEYEERVLSNVQAQREAEEAANRRLQELESSRQVTHKPMTQDEINTIKLDDKARQQRFDKQQAAAEAAEGQSGTWNLPLNGIRDEDTIALFESDIKSRGFTFCINKYGASQADIRREAIRLGLRIDWDRVRR